MEFNDVFAHSMTYPSLIVARDAAIAWASQSVFVFSLDGGFRNGKQAQERGSLCKQQPVARLLVRECGVVRIV
jgi:hypothetical protein